MSSQPDNLSASVVDTSPDPPEQTPANDSAFWETLLLAIDGINRSNRDQLGDRLAADPAFRCDFADAVLLLDTLRDCRFSPLPPPHVNRPAPSTQGRTSVVIAVGSLIAALTAAWSLPPKLHGNRESLYDAVAVTSLLQNSATPPDHPPETDPWVEPPAYSLDTPAWLLTAIDLDEDAQPDDDQEEAVF